jgi:hypothetical protein
MELMPSSIRLSMLRRTYAMYRMAELAAFRRRDSAAPGFPRETADDKGS